MFSREGFPAFIGWTGIVFKVIPFIFIALVIPVVFFINMVPSYVIVENFLDINNHLTGVPVQLEPTSYQIGDFEDFRYYISVSTLIVTVYLLIILSVDIALIRASYTRNHKQLLPGMLLYSLKTAFFLFCLVNAPSEFAIFLTVCTCLYGIVVTGIALSFKTFKSESQVAAVKQQYNENISYVKFDNEKV